MACSVQHEGMHRVDWHGTRTDGRVNCVLQLNVVVVALLEECLRVDHVLANGACLPRPV